MGVEDRPPADAGPRIPTSRGRRNQEVSRILVANLRLLKAVEELLGVLGSERVVLLKGGALIAAGLRDLRERVMEDVDILVRPGEAGAVCRALGAMGFEKRPGYPSDFVREGLVFDLHTDIWYLYESETDGFIARARPVACGNRTAFVPDSADHLVYMIAHAAAHAAREPKWLDDVRALRPLADPERVSTELRRLGLGSAARWFSDGQMPRFLAALVRGDIPLRGHFLRFYHSRGWSFRLRLILRQMFPSESFLRRRYDLEEGASVFPWRLMRPFQQVGVFVLAVARSCDPNGFPDGSEDCSPAGSRPLLSRTRDQDCGHQRSA